MSLSFLSKIIFIENKNDVTTTGRWGSACSLVVQPKSNLTNRVMHVYCGIRREIRRKESTLKGMVGINMVIKSTSTT